MVLEDWVWTLRTECFTHVSMTLKLVLSATWIILICDDHHNTSVTRKGILIYSAMFAQAESRPTLSDCSSLGGKLRFQHPVRSVIYTAPHVSTHFPQSVSTFSDCAQHSQDVFCSISNRLFWPKSKSYDHLFSDGEALLKNFPVQATISFYDSESDSEDEESCIWMEWWGASPPAATHLERLKSAELNVHIAEVYTT